MGNARGVLAVVREQVAAPSRSRLLPIAAVLGGIGVFLTVFFDVPATLTVGLLCLAGFGVCGFLLLSAPVDADRH